MTLGELTRFLKFPAAASLRRHLRVEEEEEQTLEDDEPLVTPDRAARALMRVALQQLVRDAGQGNVEQALGAWQERFTRTYADSRLRSRVPEEAFGEVDQSSLLGELRERIHGQGQIEAFLREHAGMTFCGPVLFGESLTPLGARLRFPALRFRPGHEMPAELPEVRLVGSTDFAWHSDSRFEVLFVTNYEKIDGRKIAPALLEPALLHLALLANAEAVGGAIAAQAWLSKREFLLHVAFAGGIQTWSYPVGSITPVEAMEYLVQLTRDFLDPTQFDLLPFDVLGKYNELQQAFNSTFTAQIAPADFRKLFGETIADVREDKYSNLEIPLLVDMIGAQVPADALAKVRRRFRLLDRGPARVRTQPAAPRGRRPVKP